MNGVVIILTYFFLFFSVVGLYLLFPFITRRSISFGITIPEKMFQDPAIKRIRHQYIRTGCLISSILLGVMVVLDITLPFKDVEVLLLTPGLLVLLMAFSILYLIAYRQMKELKAHSEWKSEARQIVAIDTSFYPEKSMPSPLWFGLYLLVILINVGLVFAFYDKIPDQIPMNFDFNGHVYSYAHKTTGTILAQPLVEIFLTFVFYFGYYMIGKSKKQIDAANLEQSALQNRKHRRRWAYFMIFSGFGLVVVFACMQLFMMGILPNLALSGIIPMVYSGLMIIAIVILSITTGQSGNRIRVVKSSLKEGDKIIRDDDGYWKLGAIYFNKEDPAIFVEKRMGVGWTMNFGRPISWVILIGLLLFIAGFSTIITVISGS